MAASVAFSKRLKTKNAYTCQRDDAAFPVHAFYAGLRKLGKPESVKNMNSRQA